MSECVRFIESECVNGYVSEWERKLVSANEW